MGRYIESVGRTVAEYANRSKIIIEKSTVPVKTAEALERVVSANTGSHSFWILSNPEFLAEGTAMKDLSNPDRVLIGGPTTRPHCGRVCKQIKDHHREVDGTCQ